MGLKMVTSIEKGKKEPKQRDKGTKYKKIKINACL